jgi:hypothetical protein
MTARLLVAVNGEALAGAQYSTYAGRTALERWM